MSDEEWAEFLFYRENAKGVVAERWIHQSGCQRWFNALRDSVTDKFITTYKMGTSRPSIATDGEDLS